MERMRMSMALAVALMGGMAVQAEAQPWRFDVGVNGGGSWLSPALEEEQLGMNTNVELDAGWLTGGQATFWLGNRLGLRANFGYTTRALAFDRGESLVGGNADALSNVNLWTGTGDLMFRFVEPMDRFMGFRMLPYLTLGAGARWTNPPGDNAALASNDDDLLDDDGRTGEPFTVGDETYFLEETAMPAFRAGLGADARLSENMAFRFEVGDIISEPPFHRVEGDGPVYTSVDGNIGELEHELYATLGLHVLIGTDRRRTVTAALEAPRPDDRPVRRDTERRDMERRDRAAGDVEPVSICVADPASGPDGILLVEAQYRRAQGDTVVPERGRMMSVREYVSHDREMLERRDELIRDRDDVRLETGEDPITYRPSGQPRAIEEGLVFVGRVNGLPFYTTKADLRTMGQRLEETRAARSLDEWLRSDAANARAFRAEVTHLYVPVDRVGCVFRPLRQAGG